MSEQPLQQARFRSPVKHPRGRTAETLNSKEVDQLMLVDDFVMWSQGEKTVYIPLSNVVYLIAE